METTRKSFEVGRRASQLENESAEQNMLFLLSEAQRRFENANEDLLRQADEVSRRVDQAKASVTAGHHVNSIGELQSAGPRFDQLCAVRQERLENLSVTLHFVRSAGVEVTDEEVF